MNATRTVVSEKIGQLAIGRSSKPMRATSSGTFTPSSTAALMAPTATWSLAQKTAVGAGRSSSSRRIPAYPQP